MAKPISLQELCGYSITTGAVFDQHYMTIAMTNDVRVRRDPEDRHAFLGIRRDGEWKLLPMGYPVRAQAVVEYPDHCILSVSHVGIVRRSTPQGGTDEAKVGDASGLRVLERTILSEVRSIAGVAYVAGTRRSVYRRDAPGIWTCIDGSCHSPKDRTLTFRSIHGFSHEEIYAAGHNGDLWQYDGTRWQRRESGTNAKFHALLCAPDGFVYVAGSGGTLARGRHSEWEIIKDVPKGCTFWGLEFYAGRLFLTANTSLVMELDGHQVRPVEFGDCPIPATAYKLSLSGGSMYLFGAKDIRRFDGDEWHEELTL